MLQFIIEADREHMMIDATIFTAPACSASYYKDRQAREALGRSKGGFRTKLHALVDALKFILISGHRNDITQTKNLTKYVANTTAIADNGVMLIIQQGR